MNSKLDDGGLTRQLIVIFIVASIICAGAMAASLMFGKAEAKPSKLSMPATEQCVPHEAWDETVVTGYQHYSLKGNSGIEKDEVPVFPADYWQANADHEPNGHYNSATWVNASLHYTSHGSNGKRDWFYLETLTEVVHHDAVVCPPDDDPSETPTEEPSETPTEEPSETPSETPTETPTTQPPTDKPVRSQQCVGNDLVVTVEFPNGNIEHTSHVNAAQCSSDNEDTPEHSIGTPRRADAPKVVVEEEGM